MVISIYLLKEQAQILSVPMITDLQKTRLRLKALPDMMAFNDFLKEINSCYRFINGY